MRPYYQNRPDYRTSFQRSYSYNQAELTVQRFKIFQLIKFFVTQYWISLICLIGCAYQIITLTLNYAEKDVAYEVRSALVANSTVPTVTVCANLHSVLKYAKLSTDYPQLFDYSCLMSFNSSNSDEYDCIISRPNQFNISSILASNFDIQSLLPYIYSSKELITGIRIQNSENLVDSNRCQMDHYLRFPDMCYRVVCSKLDNYITIDIHEPYIYQEQAAFIKIAMKQEVLSGRGSLTVYVTPQLAPMKDKESDYGNYVPLEYNFSNILMFKFKRIFVLKLPAPYTTNCRYYDRYRLISRCANNLSIEKLSAPYPRCFIDPTKYLDKKISLAPNWNDETVEVLKKIRAHCSALYPFANCYTELYILSLLSQNVRRAQKDDKKVYIEVYGSDEPDLIFFVRPKLDTNGWFVLVTSCFSFWFGVDVFHQLTGLARFTKLAAKKVFTSKRNQIESTKFIKNSYNINNQRDSLNIQASISKARTSDSFLNDSTFSPKYISHRNSRFS